MISDQVGPTGGPEKGCPEDTIIIFFDPKKKETRVTFHNQSFPNLDYLLAVLGQAKLQVETQRTEIIHMARIERIAQMQQAQQLHNKLQLGR